MRFYMEVFEKLEPYVADRLLSLERCPDGMAGECFYQKEKPPGMPADTPTQRIKHEKGTTNYVVGGQLETQLALVNLGCIAIHVWNARKAEPAQARLGLLRPRSGLGRVRRRGPRRPAR